MCGLKIQVDAGRVAGIRGNHDDVWSHGHLCPEGTSLGALHEDPDRIRSPMITVDGQWQEVSWRRAFERCTELLAPVIEKYGIGVDCFSPAPTAANRARSSAAERNVPSAVRFSLVGADTAPGI
ncbi:hypothetical protein BH10ACT9_BH10ACT9_41550 [soil metagenome]